MKKETIAKIINYLTLIIIILMFAIPIYYGYKYEVFSSREKIIIFIKSFGIWGPLAMLLINFIQVVIAVIPGGVSIWASVMMFGPVWGFLYGYIGVCLGSYVAYLLTKKFGITIISMFFKEETYEKYLSYIKNKTFDKIFFWGIVLPGFPDDMLCYLAGLSSMDDKKYLKIILLGKLPTMIIYAIIIWYFPQLNFSV